LLVIRPLLLLPRPASPRSRAVRRTPAMSVPFARRCPVAPRELRHLWACLAAL